MIQHTIAIAHLTIRLLIQMACAIAPECVLARLKINAIGILMESLKIHLEKS